MCVIQRQYTPRNSVIPKNISILVAPPDRDCRHALASCAHSHETKLVAVDVCRHYALARNAESRFLPRGFTLSKLLFGVIK
jgi:hypothetical protein